MNLMQFSNERRRQKIDEKFKVQLVREKEKKNGGVETEFEAEGRERQSPTSMPRSFRTLRDGKRVTDGRRSKGQMEDV